MGRLKMIFILIMLLKIFDLITHQVIISLRCEKLETFGLFLG